MPPTPFSRTLPPRAATNAMYNALSAARAALADVGGPATGVLRTDRTHIYIPDDAPVVVDLELHERALSAALGMPPGEGRDAALVDVLSEERVLLEDEAYSDWALRPRESLELARQEARLALARGRSLGLGQSRGEDVIEAWESYAARDPASEEAAAALMSAYAAAGPTPPGRPGLPTLLRWLRGAGAKAVGGAGAGLPDDEPGADPLGHPVPG